MPTKNHLLPSRGQWDVDASLQDVQAAIDVFYARYEQGLARGRIKPGRR
jgi:hypothetical protein